MHTQVYYDILKDLMRTYVADIVDSDEFQHLFVDDKNVYSTHLHNCIKLTVVFEYPSLNNYLIEYLKIYDNVNEKIIKDLHLYISLY